MPLSKQLMQFAPFMLADQYASFKSTLVSLDAAAESGTLDEESMRNLDHYQAVLASLSVSVAKIQEFVTNSFDSLEVSLLFYSRYEQAYFFVIGGAEEC